jgi:ketosteroid isomerase-like protein
MADLAKHPAVMSQADMAASFCRGMEAYNRGDYDAAVAGFDPRVEWSVHESLAPDATTYHGHEGVKRFWRTWAEAISDMTLEIVECRAVEPNKVLAVTRAHGTGAGSGAPVVSGRFAQVADFKDGLVVRVRLYGSLAKALEAEGLAG